MKKIIKGNNIGYLFVVPAFLYMFIFIGIPIIQNFILSFQNVTAANLTSGDKIFVGLDNYINLLQDPIVIQSTINTLIFTILSIVFQFIIGFALATFFNNKFKLSGPVRGIMMVPYMAPVTVTALIFRFMFATNVGIINYLLQTMNVLNVPIDWLTSPNTAFFAIIIANIWIGIPFNMILILSGLTTIPKEMYEAAAVDGANKIQQFFKITIPMLKSTIQTILILGFIYTFKVFDLVWVMTKGGPTNSTHLLSTYSYKLSFEMFRFSEGATVANILFIILLIIGIYYINSTSEREV